MIILGLGSNLNSSFGNRFENLEIAIEKLKKEKIKILKTKIVNNFSLSINPGEVKKIKNKIYVKCKLGLVQIISHSPKLKNGIILR